MTRKNSRWYETPLLLIGGISGIAAFIDLLETHRISATILGSVGAILFAAFLKCGANKYWKKPLYEVKQGLKTEKEERENGDKTLMAKIEKRESFCKGFTKGLGVRKK